MAKKEAKKTKGPAITPMGDRVLIKPESDAGSEKTSAAGIIIPVASEDDRVSRGKVVAVGEGRRDNSGTLIPITIKVGSKVLYKWSDTVKIDGEEYALAASSEILAVIK